jgi:hypothetical protein
VLFRSDELSEIIAEEEVEKSFFDTDEDDNSIAMSDTEMSGFPEEEEKSFFDKEDDESITLSPDELGEMADSDSYQEENDGMSDDELSEIMGDEEMSASSLYDEEEESDELSKDDELESHETEDDEPITLSNDELGNILDSEDSVPTEYEPEEDISLSGEELNNILDSGEEESEVGEKFSFTTVNKEDVKKLMSYIDELMGSMPEEFVQEFAKSEYFELYKKVMDELDI